jgi:hypothetical protein
VKHSHLLHEFLKISPSIRFVGMYDANFNKITDDFQTGTTPLLSREEMQNSVRYDMKRWETYKMFSNQLGDAVYSMTKFEKATLLTFSLGDGESLRVSIESSADYKDIIDKVQDLIIRNPGLH